MVEFLVVQDLAAGYGSLQILNGISLVARPNQITVIVGPNGSGKSTLLKTIAGLTNIVQGQIFPKLYSYMNTKVANLSGGERQMVAMSMALLRRPNTIMFDEPTANLAPIIANQVLETIVYLSKNSDLTILLVEQNASRALKIGHYAYLLVNGTTAFEGPPTTLLEHKELGRLYLGLTSFSSR